MTCRKLVTAMTVAAPGSQGLAWLGTSFTREAATCRLRCSSHPGLSAWSNASHQALLHGHVGLTWGLGKAPGPSMRSMQAGRQAVRW